MVACFWISAIAAVTVSRGIPPGGVALPAGFEEHLEQTKGQVQRLETIFEQLGESPKGKKCAKVWKD
jgi:hypothetical protein